MHATFVMDSVRIIRVNVRGSDTFELHFVDTSGGGTSHARIELTREQMLNFWLLAARKLGIDVEENGPGQEASGSDHHSIGRNLGI